MTDEARKTRALRGPGFDEKYFQGRVIDIGCGPDLVVPNAEPFDLEHGDAGNIASIRDAAAYDTVASSHCLEHMRDVPNALAQWWSLVREGGYLVLVVPDEDLYEQGGWPSLFNRDHKATFRLGGSGSWSPVSYDIRRLVSDLPGAKIINCERQDVGYDYRLKMRRIWPLNRVLYRVHVKVFTTLVNLGADQNGRLCRLTARLFRMIGAPIDQTTGIAVAQIQLIAHREAHRS